MHNWLMSNLINLFPEENKGSKTISQGHFSPSQQWFSAIASLEEILQNRVDNNGCQGVILAAPTPVFSHHKLVDNFQTGIFNCEAYPALLPFTLPSGKDTKINNNNSAIISLPFFPNDPLLQEQFCLVFTKEFSLLLLLGNDNQGEQIFKFTFDPEVITQTWYILRSRLLLTNHHQLSYFDALVREFSPCVPDYRLVTEFSHKLLNNISYSNYFNKPETINININNNPQETEQILIEKKSEELELLQALTHEIRTPLTTIKTLTKLLLKKRRNLTADIIKRIELIEQECTEQINRMELIFQAAELRQKKASNLELVPISLEQLLQQNIPQWQKQAERRNILVDFVLPQNLPQVVTNPKMLEQVLTGVIENFTRSLSTGGKIQVLITTAGNQLKLQLLSEGNYNCNNPFKSLGKLLMFQPETGSLTLNLDVTKNMFQLLGGKLTIKQKPTDNKEIFTIFLPLNKSKTELNYSPFIKSIY